MTSPFFFLQEGHDGTNNNDCVFHGFFFGGKLLLTCSGCSLDGWTLLWIAL